MKKNLPLRIAKLLALFLLLTIFSCGHGEEQQAVITGPGLVGLDDTSSQTAPLLTATYNSTSLGPGTVKILSELPSDGDIEYDPVTGVFSVNQGVPEDFFGEDSSNSDLPEFRAFQTFVLDGSTGQPAIPSDAVISSATLDVFVDDVNFADTIPTFLDLIQYPYANLSPSDFNAPLVNSTSYRAFDFYSSDQGSFVDIDVTGVTQDAIDFTYPLFQVRYALQSLISSASRGAVTKTTRSVHKSLRNMKTIQPRQETGR